MLYCVLVVKKYQLLINLNTRLTGEIKECVHYGPRAEKVQSSQ